MNFGAPSAFSAGKIATTSANTPNLFGANPSISTPGAMTFSAPSPFSAPSTLSAGNKITTTAGNTLSMFGATPITSTPGTINFGASSTLLQNFGSANSVTTTTSANTLNLFGANPLTSTSTPGAINFAATTTVPAASSITTTSANTPSLFGANKSTSTPATLTIGAGLASGGTSAPVSLSTATTTTASSAAAAPGTTMSYRQLEESINKWTIELEEQEKIFLNQATQVNSWDRMIFENGEAIVNLNEDVEKVKADQTRLEHELDFIKGLQTELEDVLKPLEASVAPSSSTATQSLNTSGINVTAGIDNERERVYQKAEQIDAQLQRMSEDLKEIIVHINAQNRAQDDSNDPIVQIGRVLNAHMDSLQWVDQSMVQVQKKLDEVTKVQELRKKESERIGLF